MVAGGVDRAYPIPACIEEETGKQPEQLTDRYTNTIICTFRPLDNSDFPGHLRIHPPCIDSEDYISVSEHYVLPILKKARFLQPESSNSWPQLKPCLGYRSFFLLLGL